MSSPRVVFRVKVRTVNPKEVITEEGLSHRFEIVLHTRNTWGASKSLDVQAHPAAIKPEVQGWHSGIRISALIRNENQSDEQQRIKEHSYTEESGNPVGLDTKERI